MNGLPTDPVERHVEIYENEYDTARDAWLIKGKMVVEYGGENEEEYEFAAWQRNGELSLAKTYDEEIPDEDEQWLMDWIQMNGL